MVIVKILVLFHLCSIKPINICTHLPSTVVKQFFPYPLPLNNMHMSYLTMCVMGQSLHWCTHSRLSVLLILILGWRLKKQWIENFVNHNLFVIVSCVCVCVFACMCLCVCSCVWCVCKFCKQSALHACVYLRKTVDACVPRCPSTSPGPHHIHTAERCMRKSWAIL